MSAAIAPSVDSTAHAVFHARALEKIYLMGEIEVHALQGLDLDLDRKSVV